ncbi:MAG: DUF2892 domain-containing protein [Candidatus Thioglobus sp.]|nr:DUF2892 domain-containing protein [Candidatus Thioglobus sp.]
MRGYKNKKGSIGEFILSDAVLLTFAIMLSVSILFGSDISPWMDDKNWQWLSVFVMAMLIQSLFTRFCFLATVLKTLFPNLK